MFIPERYRRNPARVPTLAPDTSAFDDEHFEHETPEIDADEDELTDDDFLRQLRTDVEGVRDGTVKSIVGAMRPPLKDRPWGRRHKRRDRNGRVIG
jgi:hypothetical protein